MLRRLPAQIAYRRRRIRDAFEDADSRLRPLDSCELSTLDSDRLGNRGHQRQRGGQKNNRAHEPIIASERNAIVADRTCRSAIMELVPYDLIVIGSGPGGYSAAIRAGQYGLKTALIEKQTRLGGTCLLVGCIPTKALLQTAGVWERFVHSDKEGIACENPRLVYPQVKARKDGIVDKHSKGVGFLLKRAKVESITGFATLKGGGKIEVATASGTQTLEAKNIILATGSEARMLPGMDPDPDFFLTNIEILDLNEVPKTLAVIGAGAVGVEFASIFRRFGTEVTVIEMLPRIVPLEDEDVSKELERSFKKQKIRVETGARADNIEKTGKSVKLRLTTKEGKEEPLEVDKLLIAVGRRPNTEGIGLENTNVQLERGFVKVDERQRTGEPGMYAIGDIVYGTPLLAHVATREGMIAVAHMAGKDAVPINKMRIPNCTYTEPGIGSVGLTEAQAKAQGHKVKIGRFPFVGNSRASILGNHDGFIKVVADEKYGEILGVHIIGPEAFELIAEAVTAMEAEATVDVMMQTIHAHPTLYEAVGEAFNAVYGLSINA
jgi:dihydrolipoamide dehydrogenase